MRYGECTLVYVEPLYILVQHLYLMVVVCGFWRNAALEEGRLDWSNFRGCSETDIAACSFVVVGSVRNAPPVPFKLYGDQVVYVEFSTVTAFDPPSSSTFFEAFLFPLKIMSPRLVTFLACSVWLRGNSESATSRLLHHDYLPNLTMPLHSCLATYFHHNLARAA